jgi:dihydroxyacetone kinase phosphoprotein-dependent L subunit
MMAKTKKLINAADDVIAELVEGMAGAHPDLLRREGATGRALVAVDGPRPGKVGIVVGGGSGHEPLFSGYVGRGLSDAAAIGNVFASPSPAQVADAGRAADRGAGVLFLYGNYTGDVMNFTMAAELLAAEGIEARNFQTRDDVASAPAERRHERRGIAGNFFVFKVAGAAADRGLGLDTVEALTARADRATASMGVALGPCSLPQTLTPNFEIGADEMEVGMGIHGEPGIARMPLEPADAVADRLLDPVLADLSVGAGDRVAVLVNGLGSTSMMELYILHRRVKARLDALGVEVHRSWVGPYATSMEMAGASVTLMKLDAELEGLLDHPCRTLALTVGDAGPAATGRGAARVAAPVAVAEEAVPTETAGRISPERFRGLMLAAADAIAADRDRLSALDGAVGDGDHGVTMDIGWRAIRARLEAALPDTSIAGLCRAMGAAFLDAVGASAGPLYATGFQRAADALATRVNIDAGATAAFVTAMHEGIRARGGASPGEKTMVDAWHPAAEAAGRAAASGADEAEVLAAAAAAAETGAAATAGLIAKRGRAAKLGERAVGHVDPGAVSAAVLLRAMASRATDG